MNFMNQPKTSLCNLNALNYRHIFNRGARHFFENERFLEIETPILIRSNTPDPHIDPIFATSQNATFQLHTSPEVWLKKALTLGAERIYQISRVFRDDPPGRFHSREFSMLEWYRVGATLDQMIADCEDLFHIARTAAKNALDLQIAQPAFVHYELDALFNDLAIIDLPAVLDATKAGNTRYLTEILLERGDHLPLDADFEDAFFHVMLKYIEPNLMKNQVSVLKRWPIQLAALADSWPSDDRYCQRFEIYYQGMEIANAYQECRDPAVLLARFKKENEARKTMNKPVFPVDYELIKALQGLPETAGIALGIDRLLLSVGQGDHLKEIIFGFQEH